MSHFNSKISFIFSKGIFVAIVIMQRKYKSSKKFILWSILPTMTSFVFCSLLSTIFTTLNSHICTEKQWEKIVETHSENMRLKSFYSNIYNTPGTQQKSTYHTVSQEVEANRQDAVQAVTKDDAIAVSEFGESIYTEYSTLDNTRTRFLRLTSRTTVRNFTACTENRVHARIFRRSENDYRLCFPRVQHCFGLQ